MSGSALTLFVPYSPEGEPWVVRRAHTVVETVASRDEAVMAAFRLASDLSERMGSGVGIEVQEPDGDWQALSPVQARRSARSFAKLRNRDDHGDGEKCA